MTGISRTLSFNKSLCINDCSLINQSTCESIDFKMKATVNFEDIEHLGECYNSTQFKQTLQFLAYVKVVSDYHLLLILYTSYPSKNFWLFWWVVMPNKLTDATPPLRPCCTCLGVK